MTIIPLSVLDLSLAAGLVIVLAITTTLWNLGLARGLLVAALRMVIQLSLVGFVLKALFAKGEFWLVALMAMVMLLIAGREVSSRQRRRLSGWWSFGIGTGSMFVSSFAVCVLALAGFIQAEPWYTPQYAIPILGMLLGNTMNGVALSLDRVTDGAWVQRDVIEQRLMLGESRDVAIGGIAADAVRTAMMAVINSMAVAGLVSLPGMMTGQILAGNPPLEAVKYQILIWLMIAGGSGFGMLIAVRIACRRLFDGRDRLRLDRLSRIRKF